MISGVVFNCGNPSINNILALIMDNKSKWNVDMIDDKITIKITHSSFVD
jgi:hypothetical protein